MSHTWKLERDVNVPNNLKDSILGNGKANMIPNMCFIAFVVSFILGRTLGVLVTRKRDNMVDGLQRSVASPQATIASVPGGSEIL